MDSVLPTYCLWCISGFYRNSDQPDNSCIPTSSFPARYGVNNAQNLMVQCKQTTRCLSCVNDYSKCTNCNFTQGYYLHQVDSQCYTRTEVLAKIGQGVQPTGKANVCKVTGCLVCDDDFDKCTFCDVSNGWYLPTGITSCKQDSSVAIPSGKGINWLTSLLANCASTGCLQCKLNKEQCTACDKNNGYALDTVTRVCVNTFPAGQGINLVTGNLDYCLVQYCTACANDYSICFACDTSFGYYFLDGSNECIHTSDMPPFKGADLTTGTIEPCTDIHCMVCAVDNTKCTRCDVNNYYYLDGSSCVNRNDLPASKGADLSTGLVASCSSPCASCQADITKCNTCPAGEYFILDTSSCSIPSGLPDNVGANPLINIVEPCKVLGCKLCRDDYRICTLCDVNSQIFKDDNTNLCVPGALIPDFFGGDLIKGNIRACEVRYCQKCQYDVTQCEYCNVQGGYYMLGDNCRPIPRLGQYRGVDLVTSMSKPCSVSHCVYCQRDYTVCEQCEEGQGYYLYAGGCVNAGVELRVEVLDRNIVRQTVHFGITTLWRIIPIPGLTLTAVQQRLLVTTKGGLFTVEINGGDWGAEVTVRGQGIWEPETVIASLQGMAMVNGVWVQGFQASADMPSPPAKEVRASMDLAIPGLRLERIPWAVFAILAVVDPTGQAMHLYQHLKIISKLYYININYGKRLDGFLHALTEDEPVWADMDNIDMIVLTVQSGMIGLSLTVMLLARWAMKGKRKAYLWVNYIAPKVHLIIFNLVFIDFIWFAPRTLMHSRDLSVWSLVISWIVMTLISIDFFRVFRAALHVGAWNIVFDRVRSAQRYHMAEINSKQMAKLHNKQGSSVLDKFKSWLFGERNRIGISTSSNKISQAEKIDYPSTYKWLWVDMHTTGYLVIQLRKDSSVLTSRLCRSFYPIRLLRLALFQLIIVSCQYVSGLASICLLTLEASKVTIDIYCYIKYKYLKNIICLLMEVSQSCFLALFFIIGLAIHRKRFDEIIMDFYQDAGIWIVIASCVAEYLLLITYIAVAAYEYFKNRKSNTSTKYQSVNPNKHSSFIYYDKQSTQIQIISKGDERLSARKKSISGNVFKFNVTDKKAGKGAPESMLISDAFRFKSRRATGAVKASQKFLPISKASIHNEYSSDRKLLNPLEPPLPALPAHKETESTVYSPQAALNRGGPSVRKRTKLQSTTVSTTPSASIKTKIF